MNSLESYLEYESDMTKNSEILLMKCRICFNDCTEDEMLSILEPLHDNSSLADILESLSTIKVENNSLLPNLICKTCEKIILDFRHLVKTFYISEEYFKAYLTKDSHSVINKCDKEMKNENHEQNNGNMDIMLFNNEDSDNLNSDNEELFYAELENVDNRPLASLTNTKSNELELSVEENAEVENTSQNTSTSSTDTSETKIFEEDIQEIPSIKYTCELCGDCFLYKSGFGHHMLLLHNICIKVNEYEQYSTKITIKLPKGIKASDTKCVRKFNPPIPLYKTEINCKKCKESFSSTAELKKHNEVHKTHRCEQCGAAFIKNSYLRDHLLKHSTDKCYSCKDCGQAFKYRSALAVHRREHVGNNMFYMCETCGRNFKERGTLKTHIMLKHTNERNFPCSGCDLTFKLKAARDKHYMRKHTSNRTKDYVCSSCGMAYLNKETLTRHMADKHSGKSNFNWCNVCHKNFTMKSNLAKHLRNKHNVIMKKEQF